jgi:hypothetical protein
MNYNRPLLDESLCLSDLDPPLMIPLALPNFFTKKKNKEVKNKKSKTHLIFSLISKRKLFPQPCSKFIKKYSHLTNQTGSPCIVIKTFCKQNR